MNRRTFLKAAAAAGATLEGIPGATVAGAGAQDAIHMPHQGPKPVVRGMKAVAASQHPIVTDTMIAMLKSGGNAVDAALAGAITQATVQLDMTNHTATVSFIYWEAKTGKTYQLNSMGTLVPRLPPFRTYPYGLDGLAAGPPMACIPGFMPGVAAIHARFGTKPWRALVEPAIPWAENGHPMDEFTRSVLEYELDGNTFFPSMRAIYAPNGFTPSVGELWKNPELAKTLRRLADEGPEYFTTGDWAKHFVETANSIGWPITLADLTATPPRWQDPMRWPYKGSEGPATTPKQPTGSCELTCVDEQGNWVQMMDTLQSGGIPGIAVDGVPMCGSHVIFDMQGSIAGWLGVPGFRMRSVMGNTIVLKGGKPMLSMGTPGNVHCTIPQVLSTILDYGKDPYEAATLPRLLPMRSDYTIEMETRVPEEVLRDLVKLGAKLKPLPPYDFHMGSFQQAWRDPATGTLSAASDPRRAGVAGGF